MIPLQTCIRLKVLDTCYVLFNCFNSECGCEYQCQPHSNGFDFECLCPHGFVVKEDAVGCGKFTNVAYSSTDEPVLVL